MHLWHLCKINSKGALFHQNIWQKKRFWFKIINNTNTENDSVNKTDNWESYLIIIIIIITIKEKFLQTLNIIVLYYTNIVLVVNKTKIISMFNKKILFWSFYFKVCLMNGESLIQCMNWFVNIFQNRSFNFICTFVCFLLWSSFCSVFFLYNND